jgi:Domain of unknown function (DUF5658)
MSHASSGERRHLPDRRETPTGLWDALFCGGKRAFVRRESERRRPHFLDRYPLGAFIWIVLLLFCTVADGWLTLVLLESGYHEINPVMQYFLAKGPAYFLIGKYVLAAAGLPVLVLFRGHTRYGDPLPIFVSLYAVLIGYQLLILRALH